MMKNDEVAKGKSCGALALEPAATIDQFLGILPPSSLDISPDLPRFPTAWGPDEHKRTSPRTNLGPSKRGILLLVTTT